MDDSTSYTASDLIYLYLDGEADNLQQSMLFGSLARNSELQAEFTEALRIRDAIEQERSAVTPPAHLTDDLFRKAGFSGSESRIAPTASAAPGPFGRFFGKFGAPILSAVGSALLTGLLLTQAYQSDYDQIAGELERMKNDQAARSTGNFATAPHAGGPVKGQGDNVLRNDVQWDNSGMSGSEISGANAGASNAGTLNAGTRNANPSAAGIANRENARRAQASQSASPLVPAYDAARNNEVRNNDARNNDGAGRAMLTNRTAPPASNESTESLLPATSERTVEQTQLRTGENSALIAAREMHEERAIHSSSQPLAYDSPLGPSDEDEPAYRFAVQLRGITDVGFYPLRTVDKEAQPWYNNMSIGALYQISRHHAVGVEAGQELFPLYRFDGVTSRLEPRLVWAGGIYRFETGAIEPLGTLRPFVQTTLGGTLSGPIAKGIMGLTYTPDSRVDLSLGLEGTALLYQLHGDWYSTRKMGITYLMNVHF